MLNEEDMEKYIDLGVRQGVIEAVMGSNAEERIQASLQEKGVRPSPYPVVPPELYGVVNLYVPVQSQTGEDQELVHSSRSTVARWGNQAVPAIMATDFAALQSHEVGHYTAYLTAYIDYLVGQVSLLDTRLTLRKNQHRQLLDLLPGYVYDDVPSRERTRCIKADPFMRALADQIAELDAEKTTLERTVKVLEDQLRAVSRDLERRRQALQAGMDGGFGGGMARKKREALISGGRRGK